MARTQNKYRDGDIIFREGDPSDTAFVILDGRVELTKTGDGDPMQLALLRKGEMFGEMGIIDQSPRSATAKASGRVSIEIIPKDEFLNDLETDTKLAVSVIKKLVQRLRSADELLVQRPTHKQAAKSPRENKPGLLARLLGGGDRRPKTERMEIRVAPIIGDEDGEQTRRIVAALEKRKNVRVKVLPEPLETGSGPNHPPMTPSIVTTVRTRLSDADGALLIWGDMPGAGAASRIRFVSLVEDDSDRPGVVGPSAVLPLPVDFGDGFGDLLYAIALAATIPGSESALQHFGEALPEALESSKPVIQNLPSDLTSRERSNAHVCYGSAVASLAHYRASAELFQAAADSYKSALSTLSSRDMSVEWALVQGQLGTVLHCVAERTNDAVILEEAANIFRKALEVLTKSDFPREWAAIQNRLGAILYRLDLKSSDGDFLKEALGAFQAALQVYSRNDTPMRWADVMNNIGQAAQVMGQQHRSQEIMEKAVEACEAALEIRTRDKSANLWASSQNNLGSALFLLGRHTNDVNHLERSAEAFQKAFDLYASMGSERMTSVIEKNLAHVERLLRERYGRQPKKMWFEEEEVEEIIEPPKRRRKRPETT